MTALDVGIRSTQGEKRPVVRVYASLKGKEIERDV